jgi:hypothetical protein
MTLFRLSITRSLTHSVGLVLLGLALLDITALGARAQTEAAPEPSVAEKLVFTKPHLANVTPPRTLGYAYVHRGGTEPDLAERMTLRLRRTSGGGCCVVSGTFLSGARQVTLPEIPDASANPALLYYLENEVRELQRLTRGQSGHFRKRIRLALVDRATITDTTVSWGGKEWPAQAVRITPFVDDPFRNRFERLAPKEYTFVLAEGVPGGLYQIRGALPGAPEFDSLTLDEPGATPSDKR